MPHDRSGFSLRWPKGQQLVGQIGQQVVAQFEALEAELKKDEDSE